MANKLDMTLSILQSDWKPFLLVHNYADFQEFTYTNIVEYYFTAFQNDGHSLLYISKKLLEILLNNYRCVKNCNDRLTKEEMALGEYFAFATLLSQITDTTIRQQRSHIILQKHFGGKLKDLKLFNQILHNLEKLAPSLRQEGAPYPFIFYSIKKLMDANFDNELLVYFKAISIFTANCIMQIPYCTIDYSTETIFIACIENTLRKQKFSHVKDKIKDILRKYTIDDNVEQLIKECNKEATKISSCQNTKDNNFFEIYK